jgi:hypothetical protein
MAGLWQSIEPAVTAALIGLIPALGAAATQWLVTKRYQMVAAQEAIREAKARSVAVPEDIPPSVEERWGVDGLRAKRPELTEGQALDLVRKAAAKDTSG